MLLSPLLALLAVIVLTLNATIGGLIYLSARRSRGESLDQIYAPFQGTG